MKIKEVIKVSDINEEKINYLAQNIKLGKIFIFPTSTVYGIGANAFNDEAVKKVYEIKKRDKSKPLIVLASDMKMVESITKNMNDIERKLGNIYWPGGLTIILEKNESISDIITNGSKFVAVRIDENSIIRDIIKIANTPIVAPSANISSFPCRVDFNDIDIRLKEESDFLIDSGIIENGKESTIVKVENEMVRILREGKVTEDNLIKNGFKVIK